MEQFPSKESLESYDYAHVATRARVAVYEDMKMAPRIIEVQPGPTKEFIEELADCINTQRIALGGNIPYSAIREVAENFIHAQFKEVVVSILDGGNTIRFCDQGPGISDKSQAVRPGFTSATEPMKEFIRGVGSGLPLVKDYLDYSNGEITIEDNMGNGAVVTISLVPRTPAPQRPFIPTPELKDREIQALIYLSEEGAVSNKELSDYLGVGVSSAHNVFTKLEEYGLVEKSGNKRRLLTDLGSEVLKRIQTS